MATTYLKNVTTRRDNRIMIYPLLPVCGDISQRCGIIAIKASSIPKTINNDHTDDS